MFSSWVRVWIKCSSWGATGIRALPVYVVIVLSWAAHVAQNPALSAEFTVNSNLIARDGIPGDGVCDTSAEAGKPSGICTLLTAVDEANALIGPDAVAFNIGGGGSQQIRLFVDDGNGGVEQAQLTITDTLTIDGSTQPGFVDVPLIEISSGNGLLLEAGADDSIIQHLLINRSTAQGIGVNDAVNVTVRNCFLGTDATLLAAAGNFFGIGANNTRGLLIRDNVISGNTSGGILLEETAGTHIEGNLIGLVNSGESTLGNGVTRAGILISGNRQGTSMIPGQPVNTVGGPQAAQRNIIAANEVGVRLSATNGHLIENNFIGSDDDGEDNGFGNRFAGVHLLNSDANAIRANLITGSVPSVLNGGGYGVLLQNSDNNAMSRNTIGSDSRGLPGLGNASHGLFVSRSNENLIGANEINNNGLNDFGHGIYLLSASENQVFGNFVGHSIGVGIGLQNRGDGIRIDTFNQHPANNNSVGNLLFGGLSNWIANNAGSGVAVVSSQASSNMIVGNAIFNNGDLGIDLAASANPANVPDGVTANDPGDIDGGGNGLQNFPTSLDVTPAAGGAGVRVSGALNAAPNRQYFLQFFANQVVFQSVQFGGCDPSGFGEGAFLLSSIPVQTDAAGNATFDQVVGLVFFAGINEITMTATDPDGNTSEYSECAPRTPRISGTAGGLLGNRVWVDRNNNGAQDLDEDALGVAGVAARLLNASGTLIDTTSTDANGFYGFANPASGDYRIEFTLPAGAIWTAVDGGAIDMLDSDVDPATGRTALFSYTANSVDLSVDAGIAGEELFSDGFEMAQ